MECFGTTDFDNNSRLITLSAIIISSLHCISVTVLFNDIDNIFSFCIFVLQTVCSPDYRPIMLFLLQENLNFQQEYYRCWGILVTITCQKNQSKNTWVHGYWIEFWADDFIELCVLLEPSPGMIQCLNYFST
jgi:hypothetical protein